MSDPRFCGDISIKRQSHTGLEGLEALLRLGLLTGEARLLLAGF